VSTDRTQEAIDQFRRQLAELTTLDGKDVGDPAFIRWKSVSREVFKRYLPHSTYHSRFGSIDFLGPDFRINPQFDLAIISSDSLRSARGCLEGAIEHIQRFGLDEPKKDQPSQEGSGNVSFQGQITIQNLAIATNDAIQHVIQNASSEADALKHVSEILRVSGELKQKEVAQALEIIRDLAKELQKPKGHWNWRNIFDWTELLLDIANNATDMTAKLSPYLPILAGLYETAQAALK
jgi:hypothetical protein